MDFSKPLKGIRVVEMSAYIAAPSTGRILAYLGAEVIKVEPLSGEPYREITNFTNGETVIFDALNAQKKSVCMNAKNPEAAALLKKLIGTADVFFSNTRAGGLARMGLDYESLKQIKPDLVYAHFSGYGEKGPLSKLPGYDTTAFFTRSGLYRDFTDPDNEPISHIYGMGDMISGLMLAVNILSALMKRERTGEGTRIECALNQASTWALLMPVLYEQFGSYYQRRRGDPIDIKNPNMQCKDGEWILFALATDRDWVNFCNAVGVPELLDDPRCRRIGDLFDATPYLYPILAKAFLKHTAEEWAQILRAADVPCERHRHVREMATDEQLIANNFIHPTEYETKPVMMPTPPIGFMTDIFETQDKGARQGEHTEEILKSLGCSDELFERLKAQGDILAQ